MPVVPVPGQGKFNNVTINVKQGIWCISWYLALMVLALSSTQPAMVSSHEFLPCLADLKAVDFSHCCACCSTNRLRCLHNKCGQTKRQLAVQAGTLSLGCTG